MNPDDGNPPAEIAIIVHYQAIAGTGDQVAALLSQHTAATQAEPGCLDFVALRGTEDRDSFVLYERYESRAAFDAHTTTPHFQDIAVARIRPLLSNRSAEFQQVIVPAAGNGG